MTVRVRCYDCHRPQSQCLCGFIESVDPRTEILILQHPRERAHAFNTARIAERALKGARIKVGYGEQLAADERLGAELAEFGLLYPSPGAMDLSEVPEGERPAKLVVLDGTWHHARAMYRSIEALHGLQHYTLPEGQVSAFRIRRQPKSYCLSTLEAIHSALLCLEPATPGLDRLMRPFDAMQRQHMDSMTSSAPRFNAKHKRRQRKPLPDVLRDRFGSLVVVYGEMGPASAGQERRPLLTFAAERPATGERMEALIDTKGLQSVEEAERWPFLRLDGAPLGDAVSLAELARRWKEFLRQGDVVAAWSKSTLHVVDAHLPGPSGGPPEHERLVLKRVYCAWHAPRGCLEEIVAAQGLMDEPERLRLLQDCSRTEERLANAVAMARHIRDRGETD